MIGWIRRLLTRRPPRPVLARLDIADDTSRHWNRADQLSANALLTPSVRQKIRARARYEYHNNPYAYALVETYTQYLLGRQLVLQIDAPDQPAAAQAIEQAWTDWYTETRLHETLYTIVRARVVDGEAFAILETDQRLSPTLRIRPLEADRFTDPTRWNDPADGIDYDQHGLPTRYRLLQRHPGDLPPLPNTTITLPADRVLHYYHPTRPEQLRGLSELAPVLSLFATLRRYTAAVLQTAEAAAEISALLYTDTPPPNAPDAAPWETIPIERGAMLTLPAGWKIAQLQPTQPTPQHSDFIRETLTAISRALTVPINVLTGDSSRHNYASGRLDWQAFQRRLACDRARLERHVLGPIFRAWLDELLLTPPYDRLQIRRADALWYYDGHEHVDPAKEATAQAIRLRNLTTTLAQEYARTGQDWETALEQIARERRKMEELGLTLDQIPTPPDTTNEP